MKAKTMLRSLGMSLLTALAVAGPASAADFPSKPITMVVPFSQGGATDRMARMIAPALEEQLGQRVVIVNQPGAGGAVGLANLAKARADGYTIGVGSDSTLAARPIMSESGYNHESFATIARVVEVPSGLAVRADSPYRTLDDLVAAMKSKKVTWSGSGIGSGPHLAMAVFMAQNGLQATYVNSNSAKKAMVKLLSGEIEVLSGAGSNYPPMFDDNGKSDIRVLGLAAQDRWQYMPEVATYKEQGFDYLRSQWFGLVAPAGTPEEAVTKIAGAVDDALATAAFQERLKEFFFDPAYLGPEEMRAQIKHEEADFLPVLDELGLVKK